jgi:hypothetical protein
MLKKTIIIIILLLITGCTSRQIKITDTTKISLENIKNKTFFDNDYSSGIIGGSFGRGLSELSMASILQGYYVIGGIIIASTYTTYKILDYNNKPIALENISNHKLHNYLLLINRNLKIGLQKNYVDINNLHFIKNIQKNYYKAKMKEFNIKNNLSYTLFIILDIDKDNNNVGIDWNIRDASGNFIENIKTEAKSESIVKAIVLNTNKFIKILRGRKE